MRELEASSDKILQIGYEGEDNVTTIKFPYDEEWLSHGNGEFKVRVLRNGDTEAYNATQLVDDRESMTLTMTVTDIEFSKKGRGELQLVYVCAGAIKKSQIYRYNVNRAIDSGVVDPPESSVINEIIESLAGIKDEIGTLDSLTTTDKSDLVSAINEVNAKEVTVDSELSDTSENPVQNKVVKERFDSVDGVVDGISGRLSTAETTLEGKANTADVNVALAGKANTSDVNTALSVKADKSYVDTELADKANSADVNTALSAKANSSDVNNALALKADTADMNTALALKANSADVQTALASKADKSYVDAEIDSVQEDLNSKAPAVLESVSGSVVSFEDGAELPAESVIVHIEPQQDLHGYDNPWPAGGGKNLIPYPYKSADGTYNGIVFSTNADGTIHAQGTSTSSNVTYFWLYDSNSIPSWLVGGEVYGIRPSAVSGKYFTQAILYGSSNFVLSGNEAPKVLPSDLSVYTRFAILIGVYAEAVLNDDIQPILFKGSTVQLFSPYSNICPITGWTGANVTRTGKNLLPNKTYQWVPNNLIIGDDSNRYGVYLKAGTYTISANRIKPTTIYCATKTSGNILISSSGALSGTFIVPNDDYYKFWLYTGTGVSASDVEWFQIELGTTATAYEPYHGETYDITFPTEAGTVYGGTLDVTNGVLTVDRAIYTFDGTENFNPVSNIQIESFNYFRWYSQTFMSKLPNWNTTNNAIMSCYSVANQLSYWYSGGIGKDSVAWTIKNYPGLCIREDKCTTVDELKAILVGQTMVYLLTTPITYQLTPQEITSLLGENHIWSDTGDIDVKYRADTKAYINNNLGVSDVQVNGTSVVSDGVAEIPVASNGVLGVVKINSGRGVAIWQNELQTAPAKSAEIKKGWVMYPVITPYNQHEATFYGLAKAAGDTTQSASSNAVGTYTETAKSKISDMLNGAVQVSGTTPTITALSGVRYVCGEVATLDITPCASGICDVMFTSGSTATVLTLPDTVKFPNGDTFTPEANTTYEINIMDGVYGVVVAWT